MNILGWDLGPDGICVEKIRRRRRRKKRRLWLFKILLHLVNLLHNKRDYRNLAVCVVVFT
jgi:hypothetical protein